jgi:hypothetical protein
MTTKYRPKKSTKVEALKFTKETLGDLLIKLEPYARRDTFEVSVPTDNFPHLVISFEVNEYTIDTIKEGDYVVFGDNDYDVMSEAQFNEIFEPAPPEVTTQEWYYPPGQTPPGQTPPGFTPYQPRPLPTDGIFPYERAIVLD